MPRLGHRPDLLPELLPAPGMPRLSDPDPPPPRASGQHEAGIGVITRAPSEFVAMEARYEALGESKRSGRLDIVPVAGAADAATPHP